MPVLRNRLRRWPRRLAGVVLTLIGVLVVSAPGAAAHSGEARFDVSAPVVSGNLVGLEVAITYADDGEPADRAIVTATAVAASGRRLDPVELERQDGPVYEGVVRVPAAGRWRIEIESRFPPGSTTVVVRVGEDDSFPWWTLVVAGVLLVALASLPWWVRRRRSLSP